MLYESIAARRTDTQKQRIMDFSSSELTMRATETFDFILNKIQTSCLNFSIQLTPFSAVISLRKSFVTDKFGSITLPPPALEIEHRSEPVISKLGNELRILEKKHEDTLLELSKALNTVKHLENMLEERDDTILKLEVACKMARESATTLNNIVNENRIKFEKEKLALFMEHKNEVKMWKRDLGNTIRKHRNLEEKIKALENRHKEDPGLEAISLLILDVNDDYSSVSNSHDLFNGEICSICSRQIANYIPDYFCGEKINPTCADCNSNEDFTDTFSSFRITEVNTPDLPPSLLAHWDYTPKNVYSGAGYIGSFRSHYVSLSNPGDSDVSAQEVLMEFRAFLDELWRKYGESFKQS